MNSIDEIKKKIFFYADEDAEHYDITEELAQPCIDLIHDTMVDLIQYSQPRVQENPNENIINILVVASGTGAEALRLFNRFNNIHIVAIDFSPAMNCMFREKFSRSFPNKDFTSCVTLLEEDFFSQFCASDRIISLLPNNLNSNGFDAVIAGFFLHHYSNNLKQEFYNRIYSLLNPGGILVHGDLFSFQSLVLSKYAHDFGRQWIQKQFTNPDEYLRQKFMSIRSIASNLCHKWIEHWDTTHIYASLEGISLKNDMSSSNHLSMLKKSGFSDMGVPFRLWEAGILWGKK